MTKTTNYQLPQWEATDPIRRGDFNAAMSTLDAGLQEARTVKPYVVGSYTGTGAEMTFEVGFRPSFLIISGSKTAAASQPENLGAYDLITAGNACADWVTFTDTGFTLIAFSGSHYPKLLESGRIYDYIAFQ